MTIETLSLLPVSLSPDPSIERNPKCIPSPTCMDLVRELAVGTWNSAQRSPSEGLWSAQNYAFLKVPAEAHILRLSALPVTHTRVEFLYH